LGNVGHAELVGATIAHALGVEESGDGPLIARIAAGVTTGPTLLLLDNFEHVLAAAPLVGDLLSRCPALRVLVTSRSPLRLRDEQELAVPPLSLADAVTLFVRSARSRWPTFDPTPDRLAAVEGICRRLDCLPLAIELAAPWIKVLPPRALLKRLADRLELLVAGPLDLPERQRTMRAAMQWSYELLSPEEQVVLRRVSVFAGRAGLEAMEAVCGCELRQTLNAVAGLVDRSLLLREVTDEGEDAGIVLLETIREYGRELLEASGEVDATSAAHAAHFAAVVREASEGMMAGDQGRWFARLDRDLDNIRAAMSWALDRGEAELGLRIATDMRQFFDARGHLREGQAWLEDWLLPPNLELPTDVRARALNASGELAWRLGDYAVATERCEASLELNRAIGDQRGVGKALTTLAAIAWEQARFERAARLCEESLALWCALDDQWQIAYATHGLALSLQPLGDGPRVIALFEESLATWMRLGEREAVATALLNLGDACRRAGELDRARALLDNALDICREVGNITREAAVLHAMGVVAMDAGCTEEAEARFADGLRIRLRVGARGRMPQSIEGVAVAVAARRPECAARLLGFAEVLREEVGSPRHPFGQAVYEHALVELREALGDDGLQREWEAGKALSLEEAAATALA
jgi:predicted ATPase